MRRLTMLLLIALNSSCLIGDAWYADLFSQIDPNPFSEEGRELALRCLRETGHLFPWEDDPTWEPQLFIVWEEGWDPYGTGEHPLAIADFSTQSILVHYGRRTAVGIWAHEYAHLYGGIKHHPPRLYHCMQPRGYEGVNGSIY